MFYFYYFILLLLFYFIFLFSFFFPHFLHILHFLFFLLYLSLPTSNSPTSETITLSPPHFFQILSSLIFLYLFHFCFPFWGLSRFFFSSISLLPSSTLPFPETLTVTCSPSFFFFLPFSFFHFPLTTLSSIADNVTSVTWHQRHFWRSPLSLIVFYFYFIFLSNHY